MSNQFTVLVVRDFVDFLFLGVSWLLILREMFVVERIILFVRSIQKKKNENSMKKINRTSSSDLNRSPIRNSFSFKVSCLDL